MQTVPGSFLTYNRPSVININIGNPGHMMPTTASPGWQSPSFVNQGYDQMFNPMPPMGFGSPVMYLMNMMQSLMQMMMGGFGGGRFCFRISRSYDRRCIKLRTAFGPGFGGRGAHLRRSARMATLKLGRSPKPTPALFSHGFGFGRDSYALSFCRRFLGVATTGAVWWPGGTACIVAFETAVRTRARHTRPSPLTPPTQFSQKPIALVTVSQDWIWDMS